MDVSMDDCVGSEEVLCLGRITCTYAEWFRRRRRILLRKKQLDISQPEAEDMVQPDGMADNLGGRLHAPQTHHHQRELKSVSRLPKHAELVPVASFPFRFGVDVCRRGSLCRSICASISLRSVGSVVTFSLA
jgi:hypothetical protein